MRPDTDRALDRARAVISTQADHDTDDQADRATEALAELVAAIETEPAVAGPPTLPQVTIRSARADCDVLEVDGHEVAFITPDQVAVIQPDLDRRWTEKDLDDVVRTYPFQAVYRFGVKMDVRYTNEEAFDRDRT